MFVLILGNPLIQMFEFILILYQIIFNEMTSKAAIDL